MRASQLANTVFCFISLGGCELKSQHHSSKEGVSLPGPSKVYPVDPRVHVDLPSTDPLNPSTFPRDISNAFAYSRYAIGLATSSQSLFDAKSEGELGEALKNLMSASTISPEEISETYKLTLSDVEKSEASKKVKDLFPESLLEGAFPEKSFLFAKRIARCASDTGASQKQCCEAFLAPMLLFSDEVLPPSYRDAKEASKIDFSSLMKEADSNSAVFKHAGARVWLSQCNYPATSFPKDLADFKSQYGDYSKWSGDLHPYSMAKQGPRRIYRQSAPSVSVAETLGENCVVRETEVVIQGPTGITTFGVFDSKGHRIEFSEFPIANGNSSIRIVPESCLGCHLKFDTRKFNVRIPSYVGLGLAVMEQHRVKIKGDLAACALPGENIILDKP
ncbi:MAG: hypothetical protein WCI18_14190 [Pseudomonadota bacterium]